MLTFEPISLEMQEPYLKRLSSSMIDASDYSFINLWAWAGELGLQWAWEEGTVWIRQTRPELRYWSPVGTMREMSLKDIGQRLGEPPVVFIRVPQNMMLLMHGMLEDGIEVREAREHWDYLYQFRELEGLSGNRYHRKKNLVNQFRRKYSYQYVDLDEGLIEQTKDMQEDWCIWRDCESSETLSAENRAIDRVLGSWKALRNINGGALIVDGKIVAFSIAERFSPQTLIIHFEKGFTDYAGVYQAMNQMLLSARSGFSLVNRQQDLNEEGLRKAKLSYHPSDFVRKYEITLK